METSQNWTPEEEDFDIDDLEMSELETEHNIELDFITEEEYEMMKQLANDRITMDRIDPMWAGAWHSMEAPVRRR